ncbi:hypothetical protein Poli38472_014697 [Pythium oligandrum]|uniref:FAD-binding 8 domain-containing protein n=1 Tax=Pythium oligandrum TaxID=41045 RepID=A0A8K1FLM6_PYTOL|nr:hypothetical protein Poli38472_014697 [Pythium oligandrum]|eukprot:TMW63992.1 hypothetical protein Poli38472_014697 [Pythium oligandrum]
MTPAHTPPLPVVPEQTQWQEDADPIDPRTRTEQRIPAISTLPRLARDPTPDSRRQQQRPSDLASLHTARNIEALRSMQSSSFRRSSGNRPRRGSSGRGGDSDLHTGSSAGGNANAALYRGSEIDLMATCPSSWRSNGGGGDFVLDTSLSGRHGAQSGAETVELPDEDENAVAQNQRAARTAGLVWSMTMCSMLVMACSSVFFVSSQYFDPIAGTGMKVTFLEWFDTPLDEEETRAEALEALQMNKQDVATGHAELANPVYFSLFVACPVMISAILYELFVRSYEGSQLRALLRPLQWTRAPWRLFNGINNGEAIFVVVILLTNILVFVVALATQLHRVHKGWDVDHIPHKVDGLTSNEVHDNVLKAIANAFGYCGIVSISFVLLLSARPTSNFLLSDVFGLTRERGMVFLKGTAVWIGIASVFHVAFYINTYTNEEVFGKRFGYLLYSSDTDEYDNIAEEALNEWLHARDVYLGWMVFFGELAAICLTVLTVATVFSRVLRKKTSEVDQFVQKFCGIIGFFCLHLHYDSTIWWLYPSLCLVVVNLIHSRANGDTPVQVIDFSPLRNGVTRLVLAASHSLEQASKSRSGLAGRFVFVCLPSVRRFQWHALYVATSPTAASESITVYAKSCGRWSQAVYEHAKLCREKKSFPLVFVDGYYGNQAIDRVLSASHVLLVAVGDLHAPYALSIFQELLALYAAHAHPRHLRKVVLVWSTDNLSFMKEMEPMLRELKKLDSHGDIFQVRLYLTGKPCDEDIEAFPDRQPLSQFAEKQFGASRLIGERQPVPFQRALFSSTVYLIASKLVVVLGTALLLYSVRYQASGHEFWVLVRLTEVAMVFVGGLLGYCLVYAERRMIQTVLSFMNVDRYSAADVPATDEMSVRAERMVAGGFDVIGTYEFESGIGFQEEYSVRVNARPPQYEQLLDEMWKSSRKEDLAGDPVFQQQRTSCVEIAAPRGHDIAAQFRADQRQRMDLHIEEMTR